MAPSELFMCRKQFARHNKQAFGVAINMEKLKWAKQQSYFYYWITSSDKYLMEQEGRRNLVERYPEAGREL